jgi:hypothetical protein
LKWYWLGWVTFYLFIDIGDIQCLFWLADDENYKSLIYWPVIPGAFLDALRHAHEAAVLNPFISLISVRHVVDGLVEMLGFLVPNLVGELEWVYPAHADVLFVQFSEFFEFEQVVALVLEHRLKGLIHIARQVSRMDKFREMDDGGLAAHHSQRIRGIHE